MTEIRNISAKIQTERPVYKSGKKSKGLSFEDFFNQQACKDTKESIHKKNVSVDKDLSTKKISKKKNDFSKAQCNEKKIQENSENDAFDKNVDEMDSKDWEEIVEGLGTVVSGLIQKISEKFGVSIDEVNNMISQLDLGKYELFQPAHLTELLLAVSGAKDRSALLMDGEMYRRFHELFQEADELLEGYSEMYGLEDDMLLQAMREQNPTKEERVIPIQVEIEGMDDENVNPVHGEQSSEEISVGEEETDDSNVEMNLHLGSNTQASFYFQNMNEDAVVLDLDAVQKSTTVWNEDTEQIMRQILDFMKINVKSEVSNLEMQLHPAELGTLHIHVASKNGTITAQFVAQNEGVKNALESQMIQLKESFAEQGVKIDAIEVTVQTHQFEQNLEQGNERGNSDARRNNKSRKNSFEELSDVSELEDETDEITAKMMETAGNTVNYTA